jgi:hypothetical protein
MDLQAHIVTAAAKSVAGASSADIADTLKSGH